MHPMLVLAATTLAGMFDRLRAGLRRDGDRGASTLEMVILILGLVTVATMLVAALTAAVKSRTDQIN